MTAPITVSPAASDLETSSQLSTAQTDLLRSRLLIEVDGQAVTLASWEEALERSSPSDEAGLDRAIAALRMYAAREAIEEIGAALERIDIGEYGICPGCGFPISFEHLRAIPQARLCAACPPSATPSVDRTPGPCLGSRRGSPRRPHQSNPHTSENPRGNPMAR